MHPEADAVQRHECGFFVAAKDRKRIAAAQALLLALRPLDARHDRGWTASLPLGRGVTRPTGF
jgi:hypothetical protein